MRYVLADNCERCGGTVALILMNGRNKFGKEVTLVDTAIC